MSIIKVEHLEKSYGDVTPIKDMNFEVNEGDVISIIGPSGTGKSTLIRCINLLDEPTAGKVYVDGECVNDAGYNLSKLRMKVGMVFQSFNLFSHKTILENVMMAPIDLLGLSQEEAESRAKELLDSVGLISKCESYPDELSGGQKQRVAIARALAMNPELLLLDEPTSALDPTMVHEVELIIKKLARAGKTMMIVTHEMEFAKAVSNRVFYLDEGVIYEQGTPEEIFNNPSKEKTQKFVNKTEKYEWDSEKTSWDNFTRNLIDFLEENDVSMRLCNLINLMLEESFVGVIREENYEQRMRIKVEYSRNKKIAYIKFYFDGKSVEYDGAKIISKTIIDGYADKVSFENDVEGYDNYLAIEISEKAIINHRNIKKH